MELLERGCRFAQLSSEIIDKVTKHHEHVFTTFSIAFPIPGEAAAANLGLPDVLFFSLFLAAAARFGLRAGWAWIAMTASFGVTLAIASVWRGGLPALPLLAIAFLGVNADLILRQRKSWGLTPSGSDP